MKCCLVVAVLCGCPSPQPQPGAPGQARQMCSGQTQAAHATSATPKTGAMTMQLAPSLLNRMAACTKAEATPSPGMVLSSAGSVNAKGDCEWNNGVTCHFHLGAEFVDSGVPRPKVGELHCIFPSGEPKSPRVYGTHFTCTAGTSVPHEHEPKPGQACGDKLLPALAARMELCDPRCCDDGTLTVPTDERKQAGTLDVRPDFRMCTTSAELDCAAFAGTVGHTANAPMFGPPVDDGL